MMIGFRPSVGMMTAPFSNWVRKRQSERVPRACSRERCKFLPSTQRGTKVQSKPALAAPLRTLCQRQSRSAKEYPFQVMSAGDSITNLPFLGRTGEGSDSSLVGQLDVELLPTFAAIGAVVKLSIGGAEIK